MARKKTRRGFAEIARDTRKVSVASRISRGGKTLPVEVVFGRTSQGIYTATACVRSRRRVLGQRSWLAHHCGELTTGVTPTKAAASALEKLGRALVRKGR